MPRLRLGATVIAATVLLGCRYRPTPVQLQGESIDIGALAGKWEGDYSSVQSQRSGTISFTVHPAGDSAFGDVLMLPSSRQNLMAVDAQSPAHALHTTQPALLYITFVRVSGGYVAGALEPYVAPDCHCAVTTVFRGTLKGNVISGDYVTRGEMGLRQEGVWRVERR